LAFLVFAGSSSVSSAQQTSLRAQLIGTWRYVSVTDTHKDGTKAQSFGAHPAGIAIFQPDGTYAIVVTRPDLPKFASNARLKGTAAENTAAVRGSLGHFGTLTVNEAERTGPLPRTPSGRRIRTSSASMC
ncbi:MAG: lipocalin-like domain-containing protein, partial [Vulcanimicrobiaceae bacterium]